jgi:hypothetical protein
MSSRIQLALLACIVSLFGTGCGCWIGTCAGSGQERTVTLRFDGQRCSPLASAPGYRNSIGGQEEHRMADGQDYYVSCLWFNGKGGHTITVQVQSSDFAPDIYLIQDGEGTSLTHDSGSSMATFSATLPKNDRYGVLVTSVRPLERGEFTIAYEMD